MDLPLETPSRILRRIKALEEDDMDLPSLPSFPAYEDSDVHTSFKASTIAPSASLSRKDIAKDLANITQTPTALFMHGTQSTIRPAFTTSTASRSDNSLNSSTVKKSAHQNSDANKTIYQRKDYDLESEPSLPSIYVQKPYSSGSLDMTSALSDKLVHPSMHTSEIRPRSRSSLSFQSAQTPRNTNYVYDYSVSLHSEGPENATNRTLGARARTPSLSRTTPSPTSTSPNSTPKSFHSPINFDRELHSPSPDSSENLDLQGDGNIPGLHEINDGLQTSQSIQDNDPVQSESDISDKSKISVRQDSALKVSISSEEQVSSSSSSSGGGLTKTPYPNAFSSPVNNDSQVPTPPFSRRPRFATQETHMPTSNAPNDNLATPYNRRRSFLLELINSNARPRMTFPTPHPFARAGVTPRPRAHPLSQAWTPSPDSDGESNSPENRNSFLSTASSYDLTVHPRANASFDPTTGMQGVGRFNAPKLNLYMHSLNRQLQEENRLLVERLGKLGDEVNLNNLAEELGNDELKAMEDAAMAEVENMRRELEKRDSEKEALEGELQSLHKDKARLEEDLQKECEGREEDNIRWKARLAERLEFVNKGVEEALSTMEARLKELTSGKVEADDKLRRCEQTILALDEDFQLAKCRAEKAESALASNSDLGVELQRVNRLIDSLKEEVRSADNRAKEYQEKLFGAEKKVAEAEEHIEEMDNELRQALEGQQNAEANALEIQTELDNANQAMESLQGELKIVKSQISHFTAQNEDLSLYSKHMEAVAGKSEEAVRQLEKALEDSEKKMIEYEEKLQATRAKVERLEKDVEHLQATQPSLTSSTSVRRSKDEKKESKDEFEQLETELDDAHKEIGRLNHLLSQSPARKAVYAAKDAHIELLEKEKNDLLERVKSLSSSLAASPARVSAVPKLATPPMARKPSVTWRTPKTPGPPLKEHSWLQDKTSLALADASSLLAQIQVLQEELKFANNDIDVKVNKLEEAGMDIVGLTEKLEDAKTRAATLEDEVGRLVRREERRVRRLERAKCMECGVKIDVSRIINVNDGEKSIDLSASIQSKPVTPPSKKLASLRLALQEKTMELDVLRAEWETAQADLVGKNATLQDRANLLNRELHATKTESKKALHSERRKADEQAAEHINVQAELAKAKTLVSNLEETLKTERAKLRSLTAEQQQIIREKENVTVQLQRAQFDMDDVRLHLEKLKNENKGLESELRTMATADSKARHLQAKVAQNYKTIDSLRGEREALMVDYAALQQRHQGISSQLNDLRQELSASQTTHEERTHQLDLKVHEIEDLRRELTEKVRVVEKITIEKNQASADRSDILRTVARLQSDLKRVRRDAEVLGKDLKELRSERDKAQVKHRDELNQAEKVQKQLSTQIRLANEQLEMHRVKAKKASADLLNHVCKSENQDIDLLRIQHKNECRGLVVQIHYLKAKFTRESVFRADLTYQKGYLLEVLSKFEKGEKQILAAVARLDFPVQAQPKQSRKPLSLRTVAVAVRFICRVNRLSALWKSQSASRTAVNAALMEVRRKRKASVTGR